MNFHITDDTEVEFTAYDGETELQHDDTHSFQTSWGKTGRREGNSAVS